MTATFQVLIDRDALQRRVRELAAAIEREHYRDGPPRFVAVIEGARRFAEALTGLLPGAPGFDVIRAASYGDRTTSSGAVEVTCNGIDVRGQHLVLVEDIVDTGRTIAALRAYYAERGAASVAVATLLSKPSRRVVDVELEHIGFEIDDVFVIGFGMDVAGRYRELPEIAIYDEALEHA